MLQWAKKGRRIRRLLSDKTKTAQILKNLEGVAERRQTGVVWLRQTLSRAELGAELGKSGEKVNEIKK